MKYYLNNPYKQRSNAYFTYPKLHCPGYVGGGQHCHTMTKNVPFMIFLPDK